MSIIQNQIKQMNVNQFEEFYNGCFENYENAFKNSSNEKRLQVEIYLELLEPYLLSDVSKKKYKVLDVGCGKGTLTQYLFKKIATKNKLSHLKFDIIGLDPHLNLLNEYKSSIEVLSNISVTEVIDCRLADIKSELNNHKYDIILFDHCLIVCKILTNFWKLLKII